VPENMVAMRPFLSKAEKMSLLIMVRSWQYTVRGIVYTVPGIVYTNPPNHYSFINTDFPWENSKATPSFERVEGFLVKYIPRKNKGYRLDCVVRRGTHLVEENKKYQCIPSFPLKTVHMQISCW
jgi:hypothetical protein